VVQCETLCVDGDFLEEHALNFAAALLGSGATSLCVSGEASDFLIAAANAANATVDAWDFGVPFGVRYDAANYGTYNAANYGQVPTDEWGYPLPDHDPRWDRHE
jgi:hypothetical protein